MQVVGRGAALDGQALPKPLQLSETPNGGASSLEPWRKHVQTKGRAVQRP